MNNLKKMALLTLTLGSVTPALAYDNNISFFPNQFCIDPGAEAYIEVYRGKSADGTLELTDGKITGDRDWRTQTTLSLPERIYPQDKSFSIHASPYSIPGTYFFTYETIDRFSDSVMLLINVGNCSSFDQF